MNFRDDRVTVILPGGGMVICRPDQVGEVLDAASAMDRETELMRVLIGRAPRGGAKKDDGPT